MPPLIKYELCTRCKLCVNRCPGDIIAFDQEKKIPVIAYPSECWHCGSCRIDCPENAIEIKFPVYML
ncbi:MAG: 4Fe-4S dicluster domain-containing protein [Peptococcaceae bacterium]